MVFKKKGDARILGNYRCISLMTHAPKVLEMLVKERLEILAKSIPGCIPINQFGFTSGHSIFDAALVSKYITGAGTDSKAETFKVFVDLTKAYDKVDRKVLYMILWRNMVFHQKCCI